MNFAFKRRFRALNLATRTAWRNRGRPRIPGPWVPGSQHPDSLLLITLDSCRFDTLSSCSVPVISGVGPIHKVMAPSYFTYASHAAMFVGFTPGDGLSQEAIVNPKCGKLVRLHGGGTSGVSLKDAASADAACKHEQRAVDTLAALKN